MIWRAQDTYRTRKHRRRVIGLCGVLEILGFLALGRGDLAVLFVGTQAVLIWSGLQGLRWLGRHTRTWWQGLGLAVVLSLLGGGLQGCADTYKSMARMYGCDPVAIEAGYCTMPKGATK